jgi:hypothetical protein
MALTDSQQAQADALAALVGDVDLDSEALFERFEAAGEDLNVAAAGVWTYKASQAADLIDVQEGSSKRSLSQLRSSYLDMAARYTGLAATSDVGAATRATRTRPITRRTTLPS